MNKDAIQPPQLIPPWHIPMRRRHASELPKENIKPRTRLQRLPNRVSQYQRRARGAGSSLQESSSEFDTQEAPGSPLVLARRRHGNQHREDNKWEQGLDYEREQTDGEIV